MNKLFLQIVKFYQSKISYNDILRFLFWFAILFFFYSIVIGIIFSLIGLIGFFNWFTLYIIIMFLVFHILVLVAYTLVR